MQLNAHSRQHGVTLPELLISLAAGSLISMAFLQFYLTSNDNQLSLRHSRELLHTHHVLRSVLQSELAVFLSGDTEQTLSRWHELADFDRPTAAIGGSEVIRLNDSTFYVAHRGRRRDQPTALYRRRDRPTSGYYPAEEIVEGVAALQLELCNTRCDLQLNDLPASQLSGVRIHFELKQDQRLPGQHVLTVSAADLQANNEQDE